MHNLKYFQENGIRRNVRNFFKRIIYFTAYQFNTNGVSSIGWKKIFFPDVKLTSASIINKTLKRKQSNSIFIEKFITRV